MCYLNYFILDKKVALTIHFFVLNWTKEPKEVKMSHSNTFVSFLKKPFILLTLGAAFLLTPLQSQAGESFSITWRGWLTRWTYRWKSDKKQYQRHHRPPRPPRRIRPPRRQRPPRRPRRVDLNTMPLLQKRARQPQYTMAVLIQNQKERGIG